MGKLENTGADATQAIVGKESAKVGQGKAFKEGWIVKDKDTLKANAQVSLLIPSIKFLP